MATLVGHWKNLAEAQKLTQSQLVPGVIEEDVMRENIVERMPAALALGKTIKWLREAKVLDSDVAETEVGAALSWSSSMEYTEVETELKMKYIQRPMDNFIPDVYGTVNDYEAQFLWELKKGVMRKMGKSLIYDDTTYGGARQFDGLHALAALQTGTDLDQDNGEVGLSLHKVRVMLNAMKHGCDAIFVPFEIGMRWDEAYEENGLVSLASGTAGGFSTISRGVNEFGKPLYYYAGIPIIRTDYLAAEDDDTGVGSDARSLFTTGVKNYSIFGIKFGDLFAGNPGLCMGFGNPEMLSKLYNVTYFDKLEDRDGKGMRLMTYVAPLLGSKMCLGRIYDITDAAITA